jgi:hypothetical protein
MPVKPTLRAALQLCMNMRMSTSRAMRKRKMTKPNSATLAKTGMEAVGKMAIPVSAGMIFTAGDVPHTILEARDPHHDGRAQQDAAEDLSNDARLLKQLEGVCREVRQGTRRQGDAQTHSAEAGRE